MRTKITITLAVVFLLGAGVIFLANMNAPSTSALSQTSAGLETTNPNVSGNNPVSTTPAVTKTPTIVKTPMPPPNTSSAIPVPKVYTISDVAKHNSASSCWSAINGQVYDLTSWIGQHPGGQQTILSICGVDGSAAFNNQHGGQKRPANELTGFLIGSLVIFTTGGSVNTSAAVPSSSSHVQARNNDDD